MFQCKIWSFGWSKSAKSHSISVNWDSPVLLSSPPAIDVGVATRRTSANLAHRALVPVLIPSPRAVTVFPSLSPLSRSTEPSNPSPAARRHQSCAGRPPPSRRHFLAPRPPSTFLALPSTHAVPSPSPTDSLPGRDRSRTAVRHHRARSSAPLVEFHSPASLRLNRVAGELLRAPFFLPGLFPARFRRRRRRNAAAPPLAAAAPAAGCLRAGPSRAAARPRSAGPS